MHSLSDVFNCYEMTYNPSHVDQLKFTGHCPRGEFSGYIFPPNSILSSCNLEGANPFGVALAHARLDKANLIGRNLRAADLSNSCLKDAKLIGADLRSADLTNANLDRSNQTRLRLCDVQAKAPTLAHHSPRSKSLKDRHVGEPCELFEDRWRQA